MCWWIWVLSVSSEGQLDWWQLAPGVIRSERKAVARMLTFGIEEEFVLLDRATLTPVPVSAELRSELARFDFGGGVVHSEFLLSQLEYASPVLRTFEEAAQSLWAFRTALDGCTDGHGVVAAGVGTPFANPTQTLVTADDRYVEIADSMGALALEHHISGLHVHVGVPDRNAAIRALNYLRPWLPVLLAMSANSPFWCGKDTTFGSWRAIQYRRWTTAGCPPVFANAADYDRRTQALIGIGVTPDKGSISWSARLSARHPTVEIRVADAQLEPSTTLFLALLGRALVATSMDRPTNPPVDPGPELLDAALWHAARHGLSGELVHPVEGKLAPATEAIESLLDETHQALKAAGDLAIVTALAEQLLLIGTGADRQRHAFARNGKEGLAVFLINAIKNESSAHQPAAGRLGSEAALPLKSELRDEGQGK
jgi:glutamate---cysteine ligase / carboxylate-amine ligase